MELPRLLNLYIHKYVHIYCNSFKTWNVSMKKVLFMKFLLQNHDFRRLPPYK